MAIDVFNAQKEFITMQQLRGKEETYKEFTKIRKRFNIKDEKTLRLCIIRWGERRGLYYKTSKNIPKSDEGDTPESMDKSPEIYTVQLEIQHIELFQHPN